MHQCFPHKIADGSTSLVLKVAFAILLLVQPSSLHGATIPELIEQAKARLTKSDAKGAVAILETGLAKAKGNDRPLLVKTLKTAYLAAAKQSESEGDTDSVQEYRDNLEILGRMATPSQASPPQADHGASIQVPVAPPTRRQAPPVSEIETPEPEKSKAPEAARQQNAEIVRAGVEEPTNTDDHLANDLGNAPAFVTPKPDPGAIEAPKAQREPPKPGLSLEEPAEPKVAPTPRPSPAPEQAPKPSKSRPNPATSTSIQEADAAFVGKRYDEAKSIYARLYQTQTLPADRRDHWAYCRAVEVVRQMNAHPATAQEWSEIDTEIEQIRRLSPENWFAEYLRNKAAERNPKLKTSNLGRKPGALVVRGSSPDEEVVQAKQTAPQPAAASKPLQTARADPKAPIETANFRVIHTNPALAQQVAKAAEKAREMQVTRWTGQLAADPWAPRCEIYLYSNAETFSEETGQPQDSPGFSTMGMNSGKVVSRRINLRANHPNLIAAILPHEVTHVVLADLFPTQQIPRWADEGVSVLSEPISEQAVRAAELEEPLTRGNLFKVADLMAMDYPDSQYWGLYYAQSVSLTRFLVESGTPAQFLTFVKASQQIGLDSALKQVYKIQGDKELQTKWLAYARSQSAKALASTASPTPTPTIEASAEPSLSESVERR